MNKYLFSVVLLVTSLAFAQPEPGVQRADPAYTASGNMLVFRAVPRNRSIQLYLIGKEAAEVNFEKDAKLLSVSLVEKGKQSRKLEFKPVNGHYEIIGAPSTGKYNLELKADVLNKPDSATITIGKP